MSSYSAYEDLGELGKGSYGAVTKNRHVLTGDIVAIKCFTTDNKDYATVKRSVLIEVSALRELRHENIVRLFHVFVENATFYMVFEFVDRTLLDVIRDAPKKCLGCGQRTKTIVFQIIRALSFIHSRNFVHRDIKPENVLVRHDDIVRVADFGFATKITHPGQRYSTYIATRWYRAPELLIGEFLYGKGVDVWAAGAVAVEMVLGNPMANGAGTMNLYFRVSQPNWQTFTEDSEQMTKTIALVGQIPRYMVERAQKVYANFPMIPEDLLPFVGLNNLLRNQPASFVNFIRLCLNPDPSTRSTANALMTNSLFTSEDKSFVPNLITEIKQSNLENNHASALSYQMFLKKRDVYHRAARDFAQENTTSGYLNVLTRYRQLGLDEQTLRYMADMIIRERKVIPDFSSQGNDLYTLPVQRNFPDLNNGDALLSRPSFASVSQRFHATAHHPSLSSQKAVSMHPSYIARSRGSNGHSSSSVPKILKTYRSQSVEQSGETVASENNKPVPRGVPSTQQQSLRMKASLNPRQSSLTSYCSTDSKILPGRTRNDVWYKSLLPSGWKNRSGREKPVRESSDESAERGIRKWRFDENYQYGSEPTADELDMSVDSDHSANIFAGSAVVRPSERLERPSNHESDFGFNFRRNTVTWNLPGDGRTVYAAGYNALPSFPNMTWQQL